MESDALVVVTQFCNWFSGSVKFVSLDKIQ